MYAINRTNPLIHINPSLGTCFMDLLDCTSLVKGKLYFNISDIMPWMDDIWHGSSGGEVATKYESNIIISNQMTNKIIHDSKQLYHQNRIYFETSNVQRTLCLSKITTTVLFHSRSQKPPHSDGPLDISSSSSAEMLLANSPLSLHLNSATGKLVVWISIGSPTMKGIVA